MTIYTDYLLSFITILITYYTSYYLLLFITFYNLFAMISLISGSLSGSERLLRSPAAVRHGPLCRGCGVLCDLRAALSGDGRHPLEAQRSATAEASRVDFT